MLSVLWNLWKRGIETEITKELEFAWPGWGINDKEKFNIFHNAGVTNDNKGMFYKAKYMHTIPYNDDFTNYNKGTISWYYTEKIIDLKNKTVLK
jgi:hypothetical protein